MLPETLSEVSCKLELITADKAKLILSRNKSNRPMNKENSSFIAHAMKQNKFMFTGESVIIGKNGDLMDAQHRLDAIILTGKEQWMVVVRGVENDAFKYIDIGKNRTAGDVLSIQNVVNPNSFASIARFILTFQRGGYDKAASQQSNKRLKISNADISEFVIKRLAILTKSREYGFAKENTLISGNLLSALHYIFNIISVDDAADFCNKVADGKELEKDDAIFILRRELLQNIRSQRKMDRYEEIALICKAWNFYRRNRKIDSLKFDVIKDEFPKPI